MTHPGKRQGMGRGILGFRRGTSAAILLFIACLAGCNNSRYGLRHDQCLPGIQRVAVLTPDVKVYSWHTGGLKEERPDLAPKVQEQTLAAIQQEVSRCKRQPIVVTSPTPASQSAEDGSMSRLALVDAVSDAIETHHYTYGKDKIIEYGTGDAPKVLTADDVDAVLYTSVQGAVPTAGREFLKGTAMAVGFVTGIHVKVPTKEAKLVLMLVDSKTGEVLWFNMYNEEAKVTEDRQLRSICKQACRYLLKPSK